MRYGRTHILFAGVAAMAAVSLIGCKSYQRTAEAPATVETQEAPAVGLATRNGEWPNHSQLDSRFTWSSVAFPTGDADTSTIGISKGVPREARVNQPFEYKLIVTNLTPLTLDDVTVHEEFGEYFDYDRSAPPGDRIGPDTVAWNLGTLKGYEDQMVSVYGTPTTPGTAVSCASVTYASSVCMGVPVVAPELKLTMSGPAEVLKCDEIVYKLTISNPGTGSVSDVRLTGPLAEGMRTVDGQRTMTFDGGNLAAGQSREFTVRVSPERAGTFEQKARVVGASGLSADSNTVRTIVRQPKLEITRTSPDVRYLNRDIAVEITVQNVGDGIARDLVIQDTMGSDFELVRASDNGRRVDGRVQWTFGSLAPNASRKVSAVYRTARIGSVVGNASATAYCADTVTDGSAIDIQGIPALLLEGIDSPDPVQVGNTTTYTLTVTNQGSAPATNVVLRCRMDDADAMQFVSASGTTPGGPATGTARGKEVTFPAVARIAPGASATYKIVVRGMKAGQVSFHAEAVSAEITRPLVKEETTNFYE